MALRPKKLAYSIAGVSSVSADYSPERIIVDNPTDTRSRWSAHQHAGARTRQWVLVELVDEPAIITSLTFGKFHKPHPCNIKDVIVYGGMTNSDDSMVEILRATMRNDIPTYKVYESFNTRHTNVDGIYIPCKFIKIVPLCAHNPAFNTSLWHVAVYGDASVPSAVTEYQDFHEKMVTKLIAKHLRQRGLNRALDALMQSYPRLRLEHPSITRLHETIVTRADWEGAEQALQLVRQAGLLHPYISTQRPVPTWTRLMHTSPDGDTPKSRAGHQMCMDSRERCIYLFGGWDGSAPLADFWKYSIQTGQWTCISADTQQDRGLSARTTHQMVFDARSGRLFVLGGVTSLSSEPPTTPPKCDFYAYSRGQGWTRLSSDTSADDGPEALTDHQMVLDQGNDSLFVFGGSVQGEAGKTRYSGMYQYSIRAKAWRCIFEDPQTTTAAVIPQPYILGRSGHVMINEPESRLIYVIAGRRHDTFLGDMYTFHCDTLQVKELNSGQVGSVDFCVMGARAAKDQNQGKIYLTAGMTRDVEGNQTVRSSLLIYSTKEGSWLRAARPRPGRLLPGQGIEAGSEEAETEPVPRYGHDVVCDEVEGTCYLFGGNAITKETDRLADFWSMRLHWATEEEILRGIKFMLRRRRFIEMCEDSSPALDALDYLSTQVAATIDHSDPEESASYQLLMAHLLQRLHPQGVPPLPGGRSSPTRPLSTQQAVASGQITDHTASRTALFEEILLFLPTEAKQPSTNLIDLLRLA